MAFATIPRQPLHILHCTAEKSKAGSNYSATQLVFVFSRLFKVQSRDKGSLFTYQKFKAKKGQKRLPLIRVESWFISCKLNTFLSKLNTFHRVDCPTQLTLIFILWYLYLSVVFHDKYESYKYEKYSREIC